MTLSLLRATVTTPPEDGSRALRVRFDGGTATAPAFLPLGSADQFAEGDRVVVELVGRRPLVRGSV